MEGRSAQAPGQRVRDVREAVGFSAEQVAETLAWPLADYLALESGEREPRLNDLLSVAEFLHWDWEAFLDPRSSVLGADLLTLLRSNSELTAHDRLILADFAVRAAALAQFRERPSPLPPEERPRTGPEVYHRGEGRRIAGLVRSRLGLGARPISNPFELLRSEGVQVFRARLTTGNVSGATVIHPSFGSAILVQWDEDLWRQHFSAFHEFGHVIMDRAESSVVVSDESRGRDPRELRANSFASGMLLPDQVLLDGWTRWGENWPAWKPLLLEYRANYPPLWHGLADIKGVAFDSKRAWELFRAKAASIPSSEKTDDELAGLNPREVERYMAGVNLSLSRELIDAADDVLRENRASWEWAAERLRLDVPALREVLGRSRNNLQRLPSETSIARI